MLIGSAKVFDDVIRGTTSTWYTSTILNEFLGTDALYLQAVATGVANSPQVTVVIDQSGDNELWAQVGTGIVLNAVTMSNDVPQLGNVNVACRFARLKITLGGATQECRLQIFAAVRARGVGMAAGAPPAAPRRAGA